MIWLIFIAIIVIILIVLLLPLFKVRPESAARVEYDIVVYRDQLAEIDRDAEREVLTPAQAESTRNEILRRMLSADDAGNGASLHASGSRRANIVLACVLAVGLPLAAVIMYGTLGNPQLPAKPYAGRLHDPDMVASAETARLEAQMKANPTVTGYKKLADNYVLQHRFDLAIDAYHHIIDMKGGTAEIWSELGEVISMVNDGAITTESRMAFAEALKLDPIDVRARFYLGLAEAQDNHLREAVAIWRDLEKDSPKDAPWMSMIDEHIKAFAKQGKFDPETVTPEPPKL